MSRKALPTKRAWAVRTDNGSWMRRVSSCSGNDWYTSDRDIIGFYRTKADAAAAVAIYGGRVVRVTVTVEEVP